MFQNYLKTAFRNLMRNKGFSFINICGLAIGMASAILILLWIDNEVGFDRFYNNTDKLYMMYTRDKFGGEMHAGTSTPKIMATALKRQYPEVEAATRFQNITFLVSSGEKHLNLRGAFADSSFLSMFTFPLLNGSADKALSGNYNIVLTEKLAKKLFGSENAMGKTVLMDSTVNFTVSGVLKDLPNNTNFDFEYLLPWAYMIKLGWDNPAWDSYQVTTFVQLKPNVSQSGFDAKVKNIIRSHSTQTAEVFSQPISRLHLYSKDDNGILVGGRVETVRLFGIIAAFILLIACINFMNLSTARSEKRAKEVGIRKVAGAQKLSLVLQFIGESILLSLIAGVLAIIIVQVSLPAFDQLVNKQLFIPFNNPFYWLFAAAFILGTGIIAGSYPAFFLSSYKPVKVLKGSFKAAHTLVTPRKILVVLQFSFAIILIICTIVVDRQIQFAQDRDRGYEKNNLVFAFLQGDADKHYDLIRHELVSSGAALSVTKSASPITQRWDSEWEYYWEGSTEADRKIQFVNLGSDVDFVKTLGVKLLAGRDIDIYQYPTDSTAMLLNETAVKVMHLTDPIGKTIKKKGDVDRHVIGVVKDFVLESPFEKKVSPMMIIGPTMFFQIMHFKLNPANSTADNIAKAEQIFKKYNPLYPFEYVFADESYANKFREEQRIGSLAALFAGLTIFISCLGLFGLATYMAENRVKEIGVRKVLGASVGSIATLLSKDFLKLVIISFIIASPAAWWAMGKWLESYSYRIQIEWWVFAGTALLTLVIAICTVSFQAIKAAIANPVKSLRSE